MPPRLQKKMSTHMQFEAQHTIMKNVLLLILTLFCSWQSSASGGITVRRAFFQKVLVACKRSVHHALYGAPFVWIAYTAATAHESLLQSRNPEQAPHDIQKWVKEILRAKHIDPDTIKILIADTENQMETVHDTLLFINRNFAQNYIAQKMLDKLPVQEAQKRRAYARFTVEHEANHLANNDLMRRAAVALAMPLVIFAGSKCIAFLRTHARATGMHISRALLKNVIGLNALTAYSRAVEMAADESVGDDPEVLQAAADVFKEAHAFEKETMHPILFFLKNNIDTHPSHEKRGSRLQERVDAIRATSKEKN